MTTLDSIPVILSTGGDELVNEIIEEGFHAVKEDEAK